MLHQQRPECSVALLFALCALCALCGCVDPGPIRCDEPGNTCGQPVAARTTLRRLHERVPARFPEGAPVDLRAVVITAVDSLDEDQGGHVGSIWVQELSNATDADPTVPCPLVPGEGAQRRRACAMQLFAPILSPTGYHPSVGDVVDISGGEYTEFDCSLVCGSPAQPFPDGRFIPEIGQARVTSSGVSPLVLPLLVTLAELEAHNDAYTGVLVELRDITATAEPDCRGEIQVSASRAPLKLTQQLVAAPHGAARVRSGNSCPGVPAVTDAERIRSGTHWDRIIGIASYFYGPKILPRTLDDLVGQRAP